MTSQSHSPSPEDLLAHAEWARALARRLVGDASTADDVVQDTWVAALRRPPRAGDPVRPWLGRVLQDVVHQRQRAEGRRAHREREASRSEALPSAAELTQRTEAQRSLMDAMLELDELLRTVVLLRYFEGLSSAEIARRQGVPAGTVRWRLKRGLDELRVLLEELTIGAGTTAWNRQLETGALTLEGLAPPTDTGAAPLLLVWEGAGGLWALAPLTADEKGRAHVPLFPAGSVRVVRAVRGLGGDPRAFPVILELEVSAGETTNARLDG